MASAYRHQPLTPGNYIRILNLEPARRTTDPVHCTLKELCLDKVKQNRDRYEALSYVWGSPEGTQEIFCHGQVLLVTANCLAALQQLRNRWWRRALWIDAICIDQSSTNERNHQVQLMAGVYRLATSVVIWLGTSTDTTQRFIRTLQCWYYLLKIKCELPPRVSQLGISRGVSHSQSELEMMSSIGPSSAKAPIPLDWFTRVWTLQEIMFSQRCRVLCGRYRLPIDQLYRISLHLEAKQPERYAPVNVCLKAYWEFKGDLRFTMDLPDVLLDIIQTRENLRHSLSLLSAMLRRCATDPRDKVFGLYSAFRYLGITMPDPDYNSGIRAIYRDFISSLMVALQSAAVLTYELLQFNISGWPSWVPDLRRTLSRGAPDPFPRVRSKIGSNQEIVCTGDRLLIPVRSYGRVVEVGSLQHQETLPSVAPFRYKFATDSGYFGRAIDQTNVGDQLIVLTGGLKLMIARPEGLNHRLIGIAFAWSSKDPGTPNSHGPGDIQWSGTYTFI